MADDIPPQTPPAAPPDDDLKGDWESAFQAEDFMFAPQEGADDFFLGDDSDFNSATSSPYEFTPPPEQELADLPDLDEEALAPTEGTVGTSAHATTGSGPAAPGLKGVLDKLTALYHFGRQRWQELPRPKQILTGVAVAALVILPFFFPQTAEPPEPTATTEAPLATAPAQTAAAPETPPPTATPPETTPEEVQEKVRVKWPLPAFLIPAPPPQDAPPKANFVQVDITLILQLAQEEKPPTEKELLVRDIIYQFYINQPASELRRYALARGEMNRKLRAWLDKQWPDAPIEAIVFNRYHFI